MHSKKKGLEENARTQGELGWDYEDIFHIALFSVYSRFYVMRKCYFKLGKVI